MAVNKEYVSEATIFLRKMLQDKPELIAKQKALRSTWWDRDIDMSELEDFNEAKLTTDGYKYYENVDDKNLNHA